MTPKPTIIPAIAPSRVVRFQKSEQSTTGVNAQAMPDHAKSTKSKIMRTSSNATPSPVSPMTTVTPLPIIDSVRSDAVEPSAFWTTSRTTTDEARMSRESSVDMIAASTTTRKTPVKNAGNSSALIRGRIVSRSASARPGKSVRPAIPEKIAPTSKPITHSTAHRPPFTISRWSRAAMKRVRSCGDPRKARPMATEPAALAIPAAPKPKEPIGSSNAGSCARSVESISPHPPAAAIPTIGSVIRHPSIRTPCKKSEYATALKPPTVV